MSTVVIDIITLSTTFVVALIMNALRDRWNQRCEYALVQEQDDDAPRVYGGQS